MTPPERPPSRPSVPHSITRVPTAPQRQVYDARQAEPEEAETPPMSENDELDIIARRLSSSGFSAEDLIRFGFILSRKAVVETRNDEALTRTQKKGLDQSQTIMSLNGVVKRARYAITVLTALLIAIGTLWGKTANDNTVHKEEILEPIVRAEAKAERAVKKAEIVELTTEERLDAADARVTKVEEALKEVNAALEANTDALLGIAAKLHVETPPSTKKKKP